MKEKIINVNRVYWYSLLFLVLGIPAAILLYKVCYGTSYKETLSNPYWLLFFIALIGVLIFLHELIHALCFAFYAENGFKNIRFGFNRKYLAPYCHCKEEIKAWQYGVVLLGPTILLGVIPLLLGFLISNFTLYFLGIILTVGGAGDIAVFRLVQQITKNASVIDHPNEVGFYYKE